MIGPRLITSCGIMHYHATHFNAQRGIEIACVVRQLRLSSVCLSECDVGG